MRILSYNLNYQTLYKLYFNNTILQIKLLKTAILCCFFSFIFFVWGGGFIEHSLKTFLNLFEKILMINLDKVLEDIQPDENPSTLFDTYICNKFATQKLSIFNNYKRSSPAPLSLVRIFCG